MANAISPQAFSDLIGSIYDCALDPSRSSTSGASRSELRGLRWQDIDLEARAVHVRQRAARYHKIGRPKSEAGERTVPLPPPVLNALREWMPGLP